jgi:dihydrofolate reductase
MPKVIAGITTSVDGYITGPDDGPGKGLGEGGERLHYWVFGGPWSYEKEPRGEATGEDAAYLEHAMSRVGAVVAGRSTYESARHWGDKNPWGIPLFIVTHRPEEQPEGGEFTFVAGVEQAGLVDELSIIVAPVIMGGGKRLFDGFSDSVELEHIGLRQSPFATFVDYRITRK